MTEETVVLRPRRIRRLTSPVRSWRPGCTAFSRLDFPTPEGPVTTVARPASSRRRFSIPSPVFTLVGCTGYPACRHRSASAERGIQIDLVQHHGGGDAVGLGEHQEAIDQLGNGIG